MRVAIVHYWLVSMRGGEKVVDALCELYPDADVYTIVCDPDRISDTIRKHNIKTSFLQKTMGKRHYKKLLPLMPFALESFDLSSYDLVISSESGPAKGVITAPGTIHICYCHSPMRYIWDMYHQYSGGSSAAVRWMMSLFAPMLRVWDVTTAARVDHFVSNSEHVSRRILKYYRRDSTVINPPVDVERFAFGTDRRDFYLCAGQITPYKRIDLAVAACTRMSRRLIVAGRGADQKLRSIAGPTVEFVEDVDDATFATYLSTCKALLYPGLEDFGITPIEAQASGAPVIAFGKGGVRETVLEGVTGLFFQEQTVEAVESAIRRFEMGGVCGREADFRRHVARFSREAFLERFASFVDQIREAETSSAGVGGVALLPVRKEAAAGYAAVL